MIYLLISASLKFILVLQVISDSFAEENIFAKNEKVFCLNTGSAMQFGFVFSGQQSNHTG